MLNFLIVLQVLVAIFLILVVLLQPGNKGGVGAALGGAGGETVFGGRGANTFLAKLTLGAAVLFMVSNFTLSFLSSPSSSVVTQVLKEQAAAMKAEKAAKPAAAGQVPAAPTAPAAAPTELPKDNAAQH